MSPTVVLVVGFVGIGCLLRLYRSVYPWPAWTLWVPQVWLIILSSRMLSLWFNPGGGGTADALEEGSPFDRIVFIALIVAAAAIVMTRRSRCCAIIKQNPAVFSLLGFAGLSLIWSDYPDVGL